MSYTTTTDVFCDVCHQWTHGCTGWTGNKAKREAWLAAKADGYIRYKAEDGRVSHMCGQCVAKKKNK